MIIRENRQRALICKVRELFKFTLFMFLISGTNMSCDTLADITDELDNEFLDGITACPSVCARIESCDDVSPPPLNTGSWGDEDDLPDNDVLSCGGNCIQTEDRVRFGYSDCQIECLQSEDCGTMADCWRPRSDTYKRYCRVETTPVTPPEPMEVGMDEEPVEMNSIENGSVTGSEEVDELVEDPAINEAINESDSLVNFGDQPPTLSGRYRAQGQIDRAENARPIGSTIDTEICFQGTESLSGGSVVSYCESGRPGVGQAPIIGDGQSFTTFFELEGAPVTIMFSGTLDENGAVPEAEALVTYTYGQGIWEHSVTNWAQSATDCSCPL